MFYTSSNYSFENFVCFFLAGNRKARIYRCELEATAAMSAQSIYGLFNATDNLNDLVPVLNHKGASYGLVITALVSSSQYLASVHRATS